MQSNFGCVIEAGDLNFLMPNFFKMIAFHSKIPAKFFVLSIILLVAGVIFFATTSIRSFDYFKGSMQGEKVQVKPASAWAGSPAIVELFTSEGCSSCPAAEVVLEAAQSKYANEVIVLSYHVDYWDRLGWKDPFSQSIFSDRQRQYAQQFNLQSVYTPQAIVNGQLQFVGSNKQQLYNAIEAGSHTSNPSATSLENITIQNNQLLISYNNSSLKSTEEIVIELVLKQASTQVKRGENSGALLHHVNVVAGISKTLSSKGTLAFKLPSSFKKDDYQVIAFLQDKTTGLISDPSVSQIL